MLNRKSLAASARIVVLLLVGSMGLYQLMQKPSFAAYRTVDVVRLTGCGVCFGVAMVFLVNLLFGPRKA